MLNFIIKKFNSIDSTNKHAFDLAKKGETEGTIIFATEQTGGKGRGENTWTSPKGNLYFSIILRPKLDGEEIKYFPIIVGYTICAVLAKYNISSNLKWPNDIKIEGKKVGGILIQTGITGENIDFVTVGIGLNVNTDPVNFDDSLKETASYIRKFSDKNFDLEKLFEEILESFSNTYSEFCSKKRDERTKWIKNIWEIWKEPSDKNIIP